jgi:putative phosphoribosyl transferase
MPGFEDRLSAGRLLGEALLAFANEPKLLVLALPRGGVPVASEVARILSAPLDIFIVRKLGVPGHEELAAGALAATGMVELNRDVINLRGLSPDLLDSLAMRGMAEIRRREALYGAKPVDVGNKTVILVDDGVATGATMLVALKALKRQRPRRLIAAIPVAPQDAVDALEDIADEVVCLMSPEPFWGVSYWYRGFPQLSDATVIEYLEHARRRRDGQFHMPGGAGAEV